MLASLLKLVFHALAVVRYWPVESTFIALLLRKLFRDVRESKLTPYEVDIKVDQFKS